MQNNFPLELCQDGNEFSEVFSEDQLQVVGSQIIDITYSNIFGYSDGIGNFYEAPLFINSSMM